LISTLSAQYLISSLELPAARAVLIVSRISSWGGEKIEKTRKRNVFKIIT
jgi:hypothetical protein